MKSDKKLWEICMNIYREMYKKSTPKADFDGLMARGKTKKIDWFAKYYLPIEKQTAIIERFCKKHKLTRHEASRVRITIMLGAAPNSGGLLKLRKTK